ncbi:uncharacterized protein LOC134546285 [Bacillus rossius redtenbacheri]|uniref:uncharacterized protein LOC134546285 n=1 Tax=Bacillus rossius redtenbacheri TaxID=93214 RepID=UPI002FDEBCA7
MSEQRGRPEAVPAEVRARAGSSAGNGAVSLVRTIEPRLATPVHTTAIRHLSFQQPIYHSRYQTVNTDVLMHLCRDYREPFSPGIGSPASTSRGNSTSSRISERYTPRHTLAAGGDMLWPVLVLCAAAVLVTSRPSYQTSLEAAWGGDGAPDLPPPGWLDENPAEADMEEPSKRALSMLARWRPFTAFVSRYVRPRSPAPYDTDFVSAETRGAIRPYGQPLRWGRR